MEFNELQRIFPNAMPSEWHRHPKGLLGELGGWVENSAFVAPDVVLGSYAIVAENASVLGDTRVSGHARVFGRACVTHQARITDCAQVFGDARVSGDARVTAYANVCGDARVLGYARVIGTAKVTSHRDMVYLDNVAEWGPLTAFRCEDGKRRLVCGCLYMTFEEAFQHWKDRGEGRHRSQLALALLKRLLK